VGSGFRTHSTRGQKAAPAERLAFGRAPSTHVGTGQDAVTASSPSGFRRGPGRPPPPAPRRLKRSGGRPAVPFRSLVFKFLSRLPEEQGGSSGAVAAPPARRLNAGQNTLELAAALVDRKLHLEHTARSCRTLGCRARYRARHAARQRFRQAGRQVEGVGNRSRKRPHCRSPPNFTCTLGQPATP